MNRKEKLLPRKEVVRFSGRRHSGSAPYTALGTLKITPILYLMDWEVHLNHCMRERESGAQEGIVKTFLKSKNGACAEKKNRVE